MTSSRHKIGKNGRDTISGNPFNDPITALASGQLDDLDRQELEQWLSWKKREKARHIQDLKRRRRLEQRQRLARGQNRTESEITIDGLNSSSEDDHDDDEDDDHEDLQEEQRMDEESETETDYASDDESPLMRLVNAFDYLQSLVPRTRDSSTALNTDQHLEAVTPSPNKGCTFFSNSFADVRRRQATKECRQRLAKMQDYDGLPASLPLRTCGQWMQVINLQQETHFQQKNFSRTLTRHLPSITRNQEQQMESARQQQQTTSFFGTSSPFHIHHTTSGSTYAGSEPIRLKSRRDFITDKTLQTILDHCPGLCRLTISECHGITDEGMRMIRDSACVSRQTLVSLHMAGCHQITDQGLFNLLGQDNNSNHHIRSVPRFESLDLAGCCQISDDSLIPLLEQCGQRLQQLRVSDCANVTSKSIEVLAQRCPAIQWLDLARSGKLTDHCLCMLAERCSDLEWLNLARCHPNETSSNKNLEDVDLTGSYDNAKTEIEGEDAATNEQDELVQEAVADRSITMLCESCPKIQLLDLSYISTVSNAAIEALSETAHSLVCLTIIGCPGITSEALTSLARLRNKSGKLGCITMGDALGISESDIEQIMQGTLSGWQKSLVDETNIGEILGRSWDE
ncbi:hypothetical protein BGZ50_002342 [Haplosporangium sp. Z 11]|nr:hypothetical protein BGZ50_002342 [Haplosporangium sp. Z 11]